MEPVYEIEFIACFDIFEQKIHKYKYLFKNKPDAEIFSKTIEQRMIDKTKNDFARIIKLENVLINELFVIDNINEIP